MNDELLKKLMASMKNRRVPISNEKRTQQKIAEVIQPLGFIKEYQLDEKNIPDFFAEGIAVEIKIKGQRVAIYRQMKRYCQFSNVIVIVLITGRSMGLPEEISGKPCYYINLTRAFL